MSTKQCFIFFASTLFISASLYPQEIVELDTKLAVSLNPTVMELTKLFSETTVGRHDPFQVLPKIASFGNKAVPALRGFIFETPALKVAVLDSNGMVVDSVAAPTPNRVYGVMALDLIGTPDAYQVLADVAQSDTNNDVRGTALNAFAVGYYYKVQQESLAPDKQFVHLLLKNMEDTAYVTGCAMKMGDIARQGMKNWTGVDYGDVLPDSLRAQDEKRLGMSLPQYRENWWQNNSGKMKWNRDTGHFK